MQIIKYYAVFEVCMTIVFLYDHSLLAVYSCFFLFFRRYSFACDSVYTHRCIFILDPSSKQLFSLSLSPALGVFFFSSLSVHSWWFLLGQCSWDTHCNGRNHQRLQQKLLVQRRKKKEIRTVYLPIHLYVHFFTANQYKCMYMYLWSNFILWFSVCWCSP